MTLALRRLDNPPVRKLPALSAALLAVGLLLLVCPSAEAKTVHKKKTAQASATAAPRAAHRTGHHRVARVQPLEQYGPFLPLEAYDYPRPQCEEFDSVVEVREHVPE